MLPNIESQHTYKRMICGYPKTGRTWLRYMLANYLALQHELNIDIDLNNVYSLVPNVREESIKGQPRFEYGDEIPLIEMSHQLFDPALHLAVRGVFLTRDPRDIMVSHWLHQTHQVGSFDGELSEFISNEAVGIEAFLRHLESWAPHVDESAVITYESMRQDPYEALRRTLARLAIDPSNALIERVVLVSSMDHMRRKELSGGIAGHEYERSNPEALRIRRGLIGGFTDYMTSTDALLINKKVGTVTPAAKKVISMTGYFSR